MQGQVGANNQVMNANNILKFNCYCQNDDDFEHKKSITLLNQSFNFFDYIPKNFLITTQNGTYKFNDEMLKDTSSVICDFLTNNPNAREFHIDIKDDSNVMNKFENMYNGRIVIFRESELNVLHKIVTTLNIIHCPIFMKLKSFKLQECYFYLQTLDFAVRIDMEKFIIFLDKIYPKSFTISTNNHEYKCNKIGIKSSIIIKEQLEIDPNLNSYHFNYDDDELDVFQQICNFFNFKSIEINTDNMHIIKKIAEDLQINCIIETIKKIIESYETAVQTIDEKYVLIDPVIELCSILYNIKNVGIEKVQENISMSIWSSTEENVQELVCYLIQVIHNDFGLHSYIMDLIISLDKNASEGENKLKVLIPYFLEQMMFLFPYNKNNCAFVFRLIKKGLISIDDVIKKIIPYIQNYNAQKNHSYNFTEKDRFISSLTLSFKNKSNNIDFIKLKNAIFWFFPELLSNKDVDLIIKDDQLKKFLQNYLPDKIEDYKKMRESYQPDNEISKAIVNDDVDSLQRIMNNHPSLTNIIPFNLFSENENISFINYAASNGSIKCFKFLLLNHSELDKSSLYYAVHGKNIEIIRIIDQYYNRNGITIDYCFNSNDYYNKNYGNSESETLTLAPIIPAIMKHQNDIFDWIFESKYINKGITGNDLFDIVSLAVQNGNAHVLIQCIDKGFDIKSLPLKKISKLIEQSASYGFYRLTQLIINLIDEEEFDDKNLCDLVEFEDSVFCGNMSLVKLYFSLNNAYYNIGKGFCTAIERGYSHIIHNIFQLDFNEKVCISEDYIIKAFVYTMKNQKTKLFEYLFDCTNLIEFLNTNSVMTLLSFSCHIGDFKVAQLLTEYILNKDVKRDFLIPFLHAACSDHEKICQYFFDRKVVINYTDLSMQGSLLTSCNKTIFDILMNSVVPEVKITLSHQFLNKSIKNQNVEVVDFLLQKEMPQSDTLFEAISTKNVEIVNIVLKYNSKPSFINQLSEKGTALNKAVVIGEYDIVKRLLSIPGINLNLYARNRITPLISAITNFNLDIINLLLDYYGDNIESQKWQLDKALKILLKIISGEKQSSHPYFKKHEAYFIDYDYENENKKKKELILSVLKRLVQIKNIDLNCSSNKYTLLSYACEINEIEMVAILIKSDKIDVNSYMTKNGKTPLMISIENKNTEIAKMLLKLPNTNINVRDYNRKTALTIAVEQKLEEIVDLIVNNEKFDPEESMLDSAFAFSEGQISKQLFSLSSLNVNYKFIEQDNVSRQYDNSRNEMEMFIPDRREVNKTDPYTIETSLIHAVNKNDQEKFNLIINHPSFDPIKSQAKYALFESVSKNNINIFKALLSILNNDVNIFSQTQESLFSYSIRCGSAEIIEEIIKNENFDPDKTEIEDAFIKAYSISEIKEDENQPSNYIIFGRQQQKQFDAPMNLIKMLCKYDEEHKHHIDFKKLLPNDKSFFTTMNPNLRNNGDVATFLLEHGVEPDEPDNFGEYPLKYFIQNNLVGAAIALINSGLVFLYRKFTINSGNVICRAIKNISYLHLAAGLQTPDILSAILNIDRIDVNCEDSLGETPLFKAVRNKSIENIELLFDCEELEYEDYFSDILEIVESLAQTYNHNLSMYRSHGKVQLESKDDYLEYLIHILSYPSY